VTVTVTAGAGAGATAAAAAAAVVNSGGSPGGRKGPVINRAGRPSQMKASSLDDGPGQQKY